MTVAIFLATLKQIHIIITLHSINFVIYYSLLTFDAKYV